LELHHASGSAHGHKAGRANEVEIVADVSMDQILARHLATKRSGLARNGHGRPQRQRARASELRYHALVASPTQPLPMEWNPRAVFEKLFGDTGSTQRTAREARMRQHKSILDSVNEKLVSLRAELGPQDRVKVEQYTEAIRDVERRIEKAEEQDPVELPEMAQPQGGRLSSRITWR
jgi:hypothetical protein